MAKQLQDAKMPPRAAVVNGGSLSPGRYEELWQREKLAGGKSGVVSLYQDVEEIPIYSKLAATELFKEGVTDQRKKPGCCKSVGLGMVHPRALK